jgi:hypothetical protein
MPKRLVGFAFQYWTIIYIGISITLSIIKKVTVYSWLENVMRSGYVLRAVSAKSTIISTIRNCGRKSSSGNEIQGGENLMPCEG